MKIDEIQVIFLAAGRGTRMKDIAYIPKPLLTIGDQAAIALALKPFLSYGFRKFAFVIGHDGNLIEYYMRSNYPTLNLSFHYIDEALGTAHSLYQVRHIYPAQSIMACHADNIYLDNHFNNIELDTSFLFINRDKVLKPYAYVKESNMKIVEALEKPKKFYSDLVISGLFYFIDSAPVWHATEINFRKNKKSHAEWSLTDTVDTMVNELGLDIKVHIIDTPIHFGSQEEYQATIHTYDKKSDLIARAMNHITIGKNNNKKIVHKESKSSLGSENLSTEISYLRSIPDNVNKHFPHLYNFTANYYEMEFITGKNLSDYVHGKEIHSVTFLKAINSIANILKNDFHSQKIEPNIESVVYEYFSKTQMRLRAFQSALKLNSNTLIINETECLNPIYLVNQLIESVNTVLNFKTMYFTIIHGDLNLTNIMYNAKNGKIKLLDPRGKYGKETFIFGDPSYDIMRIIACVDYGYDTIARGDYLLEVSEEGIALKVDLPKLYLNAGEKVKKIMVNNFPDIPPVNYELQSILYFLNLLPFHSDSIERSLAFYYWGTYYLNKWMKKQGDKYGIVY